jgi:hypothetical protein
VLGAATASLGTLVSDDTFEDQIAKAILLAHRMAAERQASIDVGPEKQAGTALPPIIIINLKQIQNFVKGNQMVDNRTGATHNDILYVMVVACMVLGIFFVIGGIVLAIFKVAGDTTFNFFGLTFTSQSAGVAAMAIGGALVILTYRRVIKGIERTTPKR